jgi:tRNA nucleotidyltransferase (CCA-adding enzyme)
VVVEGDAVKLAQELAKSNQVKLVVHRRFGTAKLNFADFSLDITTARRESYTHPGALPDVQPGTITDDLFRRDFSINAMSLYLTPKRFGEIIDPYHGQEDIDNHLIRILHKNSFKDDATRIFRAIRYEQRLGFNLELHTAELLRCDITMIKAISGDRVRHELMKILMEEYPERALKRATELGVFEELHPSLKGDNWLAEKFTQARQLQKRSALYPLYLCLLAYCLNESENEQFLSYLNFPKKLAEAMRQTIQLKTQLGSLAKPELRNSDIYSFLCTHAIQALQANMLADQSDIIKQRIQLYMTRLRYRKTLLTGEDLKQMGVPSGPQLGDILNILFEAKLNGMVRTRIDEEKMVRSYLK